MPVEIKKQEAHHMVGQTKRCATKIRQKVVGSGIFVPFPNFDKCQSDVAGDVIFGVAIDYVAWMSVQHLVNPG